MIRFRKFAQGVAGFFGEVLPALPLAAVQFVREHLGGRQRERRVLLPDRVFRAPQQEFCLRIESASDRHWHEGMALECDGELFELARVEHAQGPGAGLIYSFRHWPQEKMVRRLEHFTLPGSRAPL